MPTTKSRRSKGGNKRDKALTAVISRLRKEGHAITRSKRENSVTCYLLTEQA